MIVLENSGARHEFRAAELAITVCAKQLESSTRRAVELGLSAKPVLVSIEDIEGNVVFPLFDFSATLFGCRTANENEGSGFVRKI